MLGKNIEDYVLEKDRAELSKQFLDKIQGSTVHGLGLSSSGNLMEMDLTYTTLQGFSFSPTYISLFYHVECVCLRCSSAEIS